LPAAAIRGRFPRPSAPLRLPFLSTIPACLAHACVLPCTETDSAKSRFPHLPTPPQVSRGRDEPCPPPRRGPTPTAIAPLPDEPATPILRHCPPRRTAVGHRTSRPAILANHLTSEIGIRRWHAVLYRFCSLGKKTE